MTDSNSNNRGKGILSRISSDDFVVAVANLGNRVKELKGETWRLNIKTKPSSSIWSEVINKLQLNHDENTRHALYDILHSKRYNIDKLMEKKKCVDNGKNFDRDNNIIYTKEEQSILEEKNLVSEPSLPLPPRPQTRTCIQKNEIDNIIHKSYNTEISTVFTIEEWKDTFSRTHQKMEPNWTDIFYKNLTVSGIKCPLKFKTPYIKQGMRKQRCRFFCCYATCTISMCSRKYQITLQQQPNENSSVVLLVRIYGEENHNSTVETSARQLRGENRLLIGK